MKIVALFLVMILSTTLWVPTVQAQKSEEDLDRFIDEMNEKYRREQREERQSEERPLISDPFISDPFISDLVDRIIIDSKRLTDPKPLIPPEAERLIPSKNETAYFDNVEPIQSVWSPSRYTQEKNIWWDVNLRYHLKIHPEYTHTPAKNVTVELVTQGMECNKNGVECPTEYRLKGTWESSQFLSKLMELTKKSDLQLFTKMLDEDIDEVRVLKFEVPLQIVGQAGGTIIGNANFILPFDDSSSSVTLSKDNPDADWKWYLVRSHQNVWVQPAETDSRWFIPWSERSGGVPSLDDTAGLVDTAGFVKWKIVVDPDNELEGGWAGITGSKSASGENETIRFGTSFYDDVWDLKDQMYRILVVRMQLNYNACNDWDDWDWQLSIPIGYIPFNDCLARKMHTLDPPNVANTEAMIKSAKMKMQEMFPLPEGRLQIDLFPSVWSHTKIERQWILAQDNIPGVNEIQRTRQRSIMTFEVIDWGIKLADSSGYDRVVILTHVNAASDSIWEPNRMFGLFAFQGLCPCSKSAIVAGDAAGVSIHEIGHSLLLGHDNADFNDTVFNNCGGSYKASLPPGKGWSPVNFGTLDTTKGIFLDGQSFMRYESDGKEHDSSYDPNDYGFANSWIQNIDYESVQTNFSFDVGNGYLGEYVTWMGKNLLQKFTDFILGSLGLQYTHPYLMSQ